MAKLGRAVPTEVQLLHRGLKETQMKNEEAQVILKKFKKEFPLSKKYEYALGSDDAGRTIDIHLSSAKYAKKVRKKLPMRYEGLRVIVFCPTEQN
mgnify:CR=1 FL=1